MVRNGPVPPLYIWRHGQPDCVPVTLAHLIAPADRTISLTTTHVERTIRPFIYDPKSWQTTATQKAPNLYSIVETTKGYGLAPLAYLAQVCQHLPAAKNPEEIKTFLPTQTLTNPNTETSSLNDPVVPPTMHSSITSSKKAIHC